MAPTSFRLAGMLEWPGSRGIPTVVHCCLSSVFFPLATIRRPVSYHPCSAAERGHRQVPCLLNP